jgi:hypothetical protein
MAVSVFIRSCWCVTSMGTYLHILPCSHVQIDRTLQTYTQIHYIHIDMHRKIYRPPSIYTCIHRQDFTDIPSDTYTYIYICTETYTDRRVYVQQYRDRTIQTYTQMHIQTHIYVHRNIRRPPAIYT